MNCIEKFWKYKETRWKGLNLRHKISWFFIWPAQSTPLRSFSAHIICSENCSLLSYIICSESLLKCLPQKCFFVWQNFLESKQHKGIASRDFFESRGNCFTWFFFSFLSGKEINLLILVNFLSRFENQLRPKGHIRNGQWRWGPGKNDLWLDCRRHKWSLVRPPQSKVTSDQIIVLASRFHHLSILHISLTIKQCWQQLINW